MVALLRFRDGPPACPQVQCSACSALCTLFEAAGAALEPHIAEILTSMRACFGAYGIKSTMILIDAIGTLADSVGSSLAEPEFSELYLPAVFALLRGREDTDMHLFPILECLSSVCPAVGLEMAPYAQELYLRCLKLAGNTMAANAANVEDAPVKDFAICGLDVGKNHLLASTFTSKWKCWQICICIYGCNNWN